MVIMVVVMFNLVVTHTAKKSVGLPPRDFDGDDGDAAALVMTDDGVKEHYDDRYQEKSDCLSPRLGSSLGARPGRSAACVEQEGRLQERLDEDGEGGQQLDNDVDQPDHCDADHINNLEQLELGLVEVVGVEETGQGNQACLAAHAQLGRVDM